MNKASKALRRSSIRLKSFSCGHSELNLIVSDMKDVRSAAKLYCNAQETVWKDLFKWASRERNEAIRESFSYLVELNRLWTEVQNEFLEQLNKFRYTFEMILEGETSIDKLREHLTVSEARQSKLRKDLHKAAKKNCSPDIRQIEQRIEDVKSSIKTTQMEISERTYENEAVKVVRLKSGLLKLSESYVDLAQKSSIIFEGKKAIAAGLPEVEQTRGMHDVRFRGSEAAKMTVAQVKSSVNSYKQAADIPPGAPPPTRLDCPPPYQAYYPPSYQNTVGIGFITHPQPHPHPHPHSTAHSNSWPTCVSGAGVGPRVSQCYDLAGNDYEQDIAGAIGGTHIGNMP